MDSRLQIKARCMAMHDVLVERVIDEDFILLPKSDMLEYVRVLEHLLYNPKIYLTDEILDIMSRIDKLFTDDVAEKYLGYAETRNHWNEMKKNSYIHKLKERGNN